jgi:Dyp-type peroxidase family
MDPRSEPRLEADDIQGNILPGFRRQQQLFVAYSATDGDRLAQALGVLQPRVTRVAATLAHRATRKRALIAKQAPAARSDLWLALALGARAVTALGAAEVAGLDEAFPVGQIPGRMGDPSQQTLPDGTANPGNRSNWVVGSPARPVDLLLIFAHDHDVQGAAAPLLDEVSALLGARPVYCELGELLPGDIEHFGFRDGVSQPGVRGHVVVGGAAVLVTTRYGVPARDGVEYGKPGQPLQWPGQFLIGQPAFSGDAPSVAAELRNGSFMVFRRLTQDVKAFYEDSDAMAAALSARIGRPLSGADLRAKMVGRFPSGAALMRHDAEPATAEAQIALNHFEFARPLDAIQLTDAERTKVAASFADPDPLFGLRCPAWSHIRKVNPRDLPTDKGDPGRTRDFQMLRRGIPFGRAYNHDNPSVPDNGTERGLLFVSYQRSIADQFELLNRDWMNHFKGPHSGGFDLLVGQNASSGYHATKAADFHSPGSNGMPIAFEATRQWVVPTGGAYLFAPSLSFIAKYGKPAVA